MFDHCALDFFCSVQVSEVTKTGPSPEVIVARSTFRNKNGEMTSENEEMTNQTWLLFPFHFL